MLCSVAGMALIVGAALGLSGGLTQKCTDRVGVIDMGSTGTRLHIYTFEDGGLAGTRSYRNSPGLCGAMTQAEIIALVKDLLLQAGRDDSSISRVPIGAYGTAGLRDLSAAEQRRILDAVQEALEGHRLIDACVISGGEEARLAMVAFLLSKRGAAGAAPTLPLQKNREELGVGLIDMGGKSVQTAFYNGGESVVVSSLDLGIVQSRKRVPESVCTLREEGAQQICSGRIRENLEGMALQEHLNTAEDLYLLSYFYDEMAELTGDRPTTLQSAWRRFLAKCPSLATVGCRNLYYLIAFLRGLGIREDKSLRVINTNNGVDVAWPLGKGYELMLQNS